MALLCVSTELNHVMALTKVSEALLCVSTELKHVIALTKAADGSVKALLMLY